MWTGDDFNGTKIALIFDDQLVVYLRDDRPDIPFPAQWDLPGGGREGDETPAQCAVREVQEEFGIAIAPARVENLVCYPPMNALAKPSWFCSARLDAQEVDAIRFGDEGQRWELMSVTDFLTHDNAVRHLQIRLAAMLPA